MSDGETASGSGADGPDRMSGVLENIAKRITTIGSVVAAIIALNTLVSGCSRDNIERYTTFRTAVEILVNDKAAERAASRKLATFLNADQKTPFVLRRSDVGSAWYLSVFVCG